MDKMTLCIDFDGVIHDYKEGWKDGTIYGSVVPGFFEWAAGAQNFFQLVVYSSRSKTEKGLNEMELWMEDQWAKWALNNPEATAIDLQFAHEKPIAFLTIDDRCVTFNGDWDDIRLDPTILRKYKAWNNK